VRFHIPTIRLKIRRASLESFKMIRFPSLAKRLIVFPAHKQTCMPALADDGVCRPRRHNDTSLLSAKHSTGAGTARPVRSGRVIDATSADPIQRETPQPSAEQQQPSLVQVFESRDLEILGISGPKRGPVNENRARLDRDL
jgi:hypothetical protein